MLALYPVTLVYNLQIKLKFKLTLCVLMGLGIFSAACSLIKTIELNRIQVTTDTTCKNLSLHAFFERERLATDPLPVDVIAPLLIWAVTEMWVVLVASSVAPLWPLFRQSASHVARRKLPTGGYGNFSRKRFGAAAIFSRSNRNTDNSKIPTVKSSDDKPLPEASNRGFHQIGSQTNLRAAMLPPGSIEMTKDFTVSETQRPKSDEFVESAGFRTVYDGDRYART